VISVGRPLIVGEVLFDLMPDGTRVLGGAPFNVAWHLAAFGLHPLVISRVGDDDEGDEVLAAMESWGMETSGVQRDQARPTGTVRVELDAGEPTFEILPDQAYDHVDGDRAARSISGEMFSILYHGSLIARGDVSRSALERVRGEAGAPAFVDVNLRAPWWNRDAVLSFASRSTYLKVNAAELELLTGSRDHDAGGLFRTEHGLDTVIVTRGESGAVVFGADGTFEAPPPAEVEVADTVGAGDAFSALFILGLVMEWSTEQTLQRALEFAAAMCTVTGATTRERGFYSRFGERGWW
jgi:fructokinase